MDCEKTTSPVVHEEETQEATHDESTERLSYSDVVRYVEAKQPMLKQKPVSAVASVYTELTSLSNKMLVIDGRGTDPDVHSKS